MTNVLFPRGSFIGFEDLFKQMEGASVQQNNFYPPHNIIKYSDTNYAIELAVAGFTEEDLEIECEKNILSIKCKTTSDDATKEKEYIHRGISQKKFTRSFTLAEHIVVSGAELKNGILKIELELVIPEDLKPRKIEIQTPQLLLE